MTRSLLSKICLFIVLTIAIQHSAIGQLKGFFKKLGHPLNYSFEDSLLSCQFDSMYLQLDNVKSDSILSLNVYNSLQFKIKNWRTRSIQLLASPQSSDKSHAEVNRFVSIEDCNFSRSLFIGIDRAHVQLSDLDIKRLLLIDCNRTNVILTKVETKELQISNDIFGDVVGAYVRLNDVTVLSDSRITDIDSIRFNGIKIKNGKLKIEGYEMPLLIFDKDTKLTDLDFDFSKVAVKLEKNISEENFWERLKEMQDANNYREGYRLANIKLITWQLSNGSWIDRNVILPVRCKWNNFGYDKSLVVTNTCCLFILFFAINLFFYVPLTENVYPLEGLGSYVHSIKKQRHVRGFIRGILTTIPYALYFSIVIFFGLKMEIKTLNLKYMVGCVYLFVQYLIGIICLAYLVNFVLTG